MKRLILKFNAHPAGTLARVVAIANDVGVDIESIEDVSKTKKILLKVVTVKGAAKNLSAFKEELKRVPAVTIKDG